MKKNAALCSNGCCTRITNLSVAAGVVTIIRDVDLHFHCGEFTVITGPNGAGKTTLLKAIAGEVAFTGEILFHKFGDNERVRPRIGYVPQKIEFDPSAPMSVEDLFALCLSSKPRWIFRDRAVSKTASDSLAAVDSSHLLLRRLGHLSGGELQRVMLSLALTPRPDLLLLDEPVSGVDVSGANLFYEMISALRAKYDLSVLMVSHDLERAARYADRLVTLNKTVISDERCAGMGVNHHEKNGRPGAVGNADSYRGSGA